MTASAITFDDVSFAYDGPAVLEEGTVEIAAGDGVNRAVGGFRDHGRLTSATGGATVSLKGRQIPESLDLQRTLRAMCDAGIESVAMEVSSHGVALGRIEGCRFRVGALTNVSQDHLDFHGSMDRYLATKLDFFRRFLAADAVAVVNVDDATAPRFEAAAQEAGARACCACRATRRPRPRSRSSPRG